MAIDAYDSIARQCPGKGKLVRELKARDGDHMLLLRLQEYMSVLPTARDRQGCAAIDIFHTFGTLAAAPEFFDILEKDDYRLLRQFSRFFAENKQFQKLLEEQWALPAALVHSVLTGKGVSREQIHALETLPPADAAYGALIFFLPRMPPVESLKKRFPRREEAALLVKLFTGMALEVAPVLKEAAYFPFVAENLHTTLDTYAELMKEWGVPQLESILQCNVTALTLALRPPMTWQEIALAFPTKHLGGESFRRFQRQWIRIQHRVYEAVRRYGDAWAGETCKNLASALERQLPFASDAQARDMEDFLVWLVHSSVYEKIVLPTACDAINNAENLFQVMANMPEGSLAALAAWHKEGKLDAVLEGWGRCTNPDTFAAAFPPQLLEAQELHRVAPDYAFWVALGELSLVRQSLRGDFKALLDDMLLDAHRQHVHPGRTVSFFCQIHKVFFGILETRGGANPQVIAKHLVDYGYPESHDPSLFQRYLQSSGEDLDVEGALAERGTAPNILEHGRTWKDKYGMSREDALTVVDFAVDAVTLVVNVVPVAGQFASACLKIAKTAATGAVRYALRKAVTRQAGKLARRATRALIGGKIRENVFTAAGKAGVKDLDKKTPLPKTRQAKDTVEDIVNVLFSGQHLYTELFGKKVQPFERQYADAPLCR